MQKLKITDYKPFPYIIKSLDLVFNIISKEEVLVESHIAVQKKDGNENKLELNGSKYLNLKSLTVDGVSLGAEKYTLSEDWLIIDCSSFGDEFIVKTVVSINPEDNKSLSGLYTSGDLLTTQCESEGFRNITFFADRPDVLTIYRTTIMANKKDFPVLMSNGDLESYRDADKTHIITWNDPHKKPSYLFALVAGDLASIKETYTTISGKEVSLEVYAEEKDIEKCAFAMEALKRAIKWDEDYYGLELDLTSYKVVAIDDFNSGAMENKGLNIFNSKCILADPKVTSDRAYKFIDAVIAHEYFHNYTGNRVTCRDWFQLTLKEGLTVFRDQQYSKTFGAKDVKIIEDASLIRGAQFAEDQGGSRHPIQPKEVGNIDNFYTVTVYDKGAEVIRMLETIVGEKAFNDGVRYYLEKFDGQAVTCQDFVQAIEESSGVKVPEFYRWYDQAGTPVVKISTEYERITKELVIKMKQDYKSEFNSEYKPLHIPCKVAFFGKDGKKMNVKFNGASSDEFVLNLTDEYQEFVFNDVEELPAGSYFREFSAPVLWETDNSFEDLMVLAKFDDDGFSRYDAIQHLLLDDLRPAIAKNVSVDSGLVDENAIIMEYAIDKYLNGELSAGLTAKLLSIPSLSYVTSVFKEYDIESAYKIMIDFKKGISAKLFDRFSKVYNVAKESLDSDNFSYEDAEKRGLMNACLSYMTNVNHEQAFAQLKNPKNFTEELAAFAVIVNSENVETSLKHSTIQNFFNKWRVDKLALTTGFSVVCGSDTEFALSKTKEILDMGIIDKKNPNFIRSTIGAFSSSMRFHDMDGSGYSFVLEQVSEIDKTNPALASRLLDAFEDVHRYNQARKDLILSLLNEYKEKVESSNCIEKINNIIEG